VGVGTRSQMLPAIAPLASLTPAEAEVARLAGAGAQNWQIARARQVSTRTVANQMSSVLGKLGMRSRTGLALIPELAVTEQGRRVQLTELPGTERSILEHAFQGLPQKEIAIQCGLAPSTVSRTMRAARERLGFGSLSALLRACSG